MSLNWLEPGAPTWTIQAETDQGIMILENGGDKLTIDGEIDESVSDLTGEYPRLYDQMASLVQRGGIDMDLSPMRHVADAFTLGKRITVEPFEW